MIDIDEFYRPYLDQYNARRRTLECLMEIHVEYFKDETPTKIGNPSSTADRITFQTTTQQEKASVMKIGKKILIDQQKPYTGKDALSETQLK